MKVLVGFDASGNAAPAPPPLPLPAMPMRRLDLPPPVPGSEGPRTSGRCSNPPSPTAAFEGARQCQCSPCLCEGVAGRKRATPTHKRVGGLGFGIRGSGFGVRGSGFGVWGLGFAVQGLGRGRGEGSGYARLRPLRLRPAGRNRNPKSKLAEVELAEIEHNRSPLSPSALKPQTLNGHEPLFLRRRRWFSASDVFTKKHGQDCLCHPHFLCILFLLFYFLSFQISSFLIFHVFLVFCCLCSQFLATIGIGHTWPTNWRKQIFYKKAGRKRNWPKSTSTRRTTTLRRRDAVTVDRCTCSST